MIKKSHILFVFIVFLSFLVTAQPIQTNQEKVKKTSLSKLKEFHQRNGLPNLFWKIKNSRQVRIAYLGGSITAAGNGWRDLTFSWFRTRFPQTVFVQTNGGIGGTGSDLGVFRLEHDILESKPDLVFIEFAVNDGGKSRESVLQTMEGIVRKTWKTLPNTELCFVYTIAEQQCTDLVSGKIHPTVLAMEELAEYYGIPTIHMGIQVAKLFKEEKLLFAADPIENQHKIVFTQDHVHPLSESGHPLYASAVVKYLGQMKDRGKAVPHLLGNPYVSNNWEGARKINISDVKMSDDWVKLPSDNGLASSFSNYLPAVYKGVPGCKLNFKFRGTALGLYDIIGPETAMLKISVDKKEQKVLRFDKYCSYNRLNNILLFDQLANELHTVEIEVLDETFDKGKILADSNLEKFKADEKPFAGNNYLLGNILIIGELVKE